MRLANPQDLAPRCRVDDVTGALMSSPNWLEVLQEYRDSGYQCLEDDPRTHRVAGGLEPASAMPSEVPTHIKLSVIFNVMLLPQVLTLRKIAEHQPMCVFSKQGLKKKESAWANARPGTVFQAATSSTAAGADDGLGSWGPWASPAKPLPEPTWGPPVWDTAASAAYHPSSSSSSWGWQRPGPAPRRRLHGSVAAALGMTHGELQELMAVTASQPESHPQPEVQDPTSPAADWGSADEQQAQLKVEISDAEQAQGNLPTSLKVEISDAEQGNLPTSLRVEKDPSSDLTHTPTECAEPPTAVPPELAEAPTVPREPSEAPTAVPLEPAEAEAPTAVPESAEAPTAEAVPQSAEAPTDVEGAAAVATQSATATGTDTAKAEPEVPPGPVETQLISCVAALLFESGKQTCDLDVDELHKRLRELQKLQEQLESSNLELTSSALQCVDSIRAGAQLATQTVDMLNAMQRHFQGVTMVKGSGLHVRANSSSINVRVGLSILDEPRKLHLRLRIRAALLLLVLLHYTCSKAACRRRKQRLFGCCGQRASC
jgi:hypothetical protein